jgi:hypothetical protein
MDLKGLAGEGGLPLPGRSLRESNFDPSFADGILSGGELVSFVARFLLSGCAALTPRPGSEVFPPGVAGRDLRPES